MAKNTVESKVSLKEGTPVAIVRPHPWSGSKGRIVLHQRMTGGKSPVLVESDELKHHDGTPRRSWCNERELQPA